MKTYTFIALFLVFIFFVFAREKSGADTYEMAANTALRAMDIQDRAYDSLCSILDREQDKMQKNIENLVNVKTEIKIIQYKK